MVKLLVMVKLLAKRLQPAKTLDDWRRGEASAPERPLRVALYSHDTQGLGHIRRNLAIAGSFAQSKVAPTTLLVAGIGAAGSFQPPEGADLLVLPAVGKDKAGHYRARGLRLPLDQTIRLRAQTIRAALAGFAPDILIVDKVPAGLQNELLPTLRLLHRRGTRCVLGLRDILDDPVTARAEWDSMHYTALIDQFYDAVWIYGDPAVYDPIREYHLPRSVADKVRFTGYIDRTQLLLPESTAQSTLDDLTSLAPPAGQQLALCLVGGGEDGGRLAAAFAQASLPANAQALLITGPYMPAARRQELSVLAQQRTDLQVLDFLPNPERLLRHAQAVISMGGYNSLCEILANRVPALIVPRVTPRREQWERANRLQAIGAVQLLLPDQVTPAALSSWLGKQLALGAPMVHTIDMDALQRLPHLLCEVAETRRNRSRSLRQAPLRLIERCFGLLAAKSLLAPRQFLPLWLSK